MGAAEQARSYLDAGEHSRAREAAVEALRDAPDEVELLSIAGRAGVELGSADAVDQLHRVAELRPDSADAWCDLGDALAAAGRTDEAADAFRRAVELEPENELALAQLGHTELAAGRSAGAIEHLQRAAERAPGLSTAAISLVELHRATGDTEKALEIAQGVAEQRPDDLVAQLDVAELSLELGRLDQAETAFERARRVDEVAEDDLHGLHGLALVAMRRGDTGRALDLAREALAIDERGLSADLALHLDIEAGGSGEVLEGRSSTVIARVPPTRDEIEAALLDELREHRRLHGSDRRLVAEETGG